MSQKIPITGALITGGGGFLGSHLAEQMAKEKLPVVCVDNFCTGFPANQNYLEKTYPENILFFRQDVCADWKSWAQDIPKKFTSSLSHVFHFASPASPPHYQRIPLETLWVNSVGLKNALQFADQFKARLTFASTSEVYGSPSISPQPESYWGNVNSFGARSCYDEGKRFGEALIFSHNQVHNTQHGLVRIFNTYGPRMNPDDGRVIINFLVQALKGQDLSIYGAGQQTRSFCFVSDLVQGILKYSQTKLTEPVNLGNDQEFTILELATTIQLMFVEKNLKLNFHKLPADDPQQRCPDLKKAKILLPDWRSEVLLKDGLVATLAWLKEQKLGST